MPKYILKDLPNAPISYLQNLSLDLTNFAINYTIEKHAKFKDKFEHDFLLRPRQECGYSENCRKCPNGLNVDAESPLGDSKDQNQLGQLPKSLTKAWPYHSQMILIGTGVVITGIGVSAAYFVLLKKDMVRHQENDAILKRESELFAKKLEMEAESLSWNQNFPTPSEIKSSLPSSTVSSSIGTLKTEAHTYIPNIAIEVQSTADYSDLRFHTTEPSMFHFHILDKAAILGILGPIILSVGFLIVIMGIVWMQILKQQQITLMNKFTTAVKGKGKDRKGEKYPAMDVINKEIECIGVGFGLIWVRIELP